MRISDWSSDVCSSDLLIEIRFERVHQRDVEPVLPDADRAVFRDAMLVPGPVGRQDEIIGPERDLVAVDIGEGALTLHDEAARRGAVPVARGAPAARHDLEPGIDTPPPRPPTRPAPCPHY